MKQKSPLYTVTNIDDIEKQFYTDDLFIDYVRRVAAENEDFYPIMDIQSAIFYIKEFCPNLSLIQSQPI